MKNLFTIIAVFACLLATGQDFKNYIDSQKVFESKKVEVFWKTIIVDQTFYRGKQDGNVLYSENFLPDEEQREKAIMQKYFIGDTIFNPTRDSYSFLKVWLSDGTILYQQKIEKWVFVEKLENRGKLLDKWFLKAQKEKVADTDFSEITEYIVNKGVKKDSLKTKVK